MRIVPVVVVACGLVGSAWAQDSDKWEISGVGGASFYRDLKAAGTNPARAAKAGFVNGVAAGAVLSQTGGGHWGGEFHYLFQTSNMRLRGTDGTSGEADFAAQSHSFHYDALLYFTRRDSRVRPFVAAGPGLKVYQASGQERAFRPLDNVVVFSRDSETKFLLSAGAGVKVKVHPNALVRVDFRDYVTGVPKGFVAVPGVRLSGQFHNFVGTVGVGVVF